MAREIEIEDSPIVQLECNEITENGADKRWWDIFELLVIYFLFGRPVLVHGRLLLGAQGG
jgi:hypothetical protein